MPVLERSRARFCVAPDLFRQFSGDRGHAVDNQILSRRERRFARRIGGESGERKEDQGGSERHSFHTSRECSHIRSARRSKNMGSASALECFAKASNPTGASAALRSCASPRAPGPQAPPPGSFSAVERMTDRKS